MGRTIYEGRYEPVHSTFNESDFSEDVIEAVGELNVSLVRYPSVCFLFLILSRATNLIIRIFPAFEIAFKKLFYILKFVYVKLMILINIYFKNGGEKGEKNIN